VDKININKADLQELLKVKWLGESKAENIIDYREENGEFKKIEDLLNVKGIGRQYLNKISDSITVGNSVRVIFKPEEYGLDSLTEAHLVGEMNGWNPEDKSYSLKQNEDGYWEEVFFLEKGLQYKIMYDSIDWDEDKYVGDHYGQNLIV